MTLVVFVIGAVCVSLSALTLLSLGMVARKPMPLPENDLHAFGFEEAA